MANWHFFARNPSKAHSHRYNLIFLALASLSLISVPTAHAVQVTFAWDPSPSTVVGYKLYYGTSDGNYPNFVDAQSATTKAIDLTAPTHYVVAKAYDGSGIESAPSNQVIAHSITSSAGTGGAISPSGTFYAGQGSSQTLTITPSAGYRVSDVLINGTSVGAITSYTLSNIMGPQTVAATFAVIPINYTITASAGTNGSISPSGFASVAPGANQTFTITPNKGYQVASVTVDGTALSNPVTSYTFNNVTANHSISATFAINTYTITPTAQANGSISPSSPVTVNYGASRTFTITPNTNYHVAAVKVDGVSVGTVTSYTFSNVTANHSISATFAINTCTITSSAGSNGTISPSPSATVNYGANQTFTITPNTGYQLASVTVDGTALSNPVTSYTFSNVTTNHSIAANFLQVNQTPVADAGPNQTVPEGLLVTLNGLNSTDPGNSPLSYMWVQTGGIQVSLSSQTIAQPTFMAPSVGTAGAALTFQLTVTNQIGLQSSDTCIVNVTWVNAPPTAKAGPNQTLPEGATVTLDGSNSTDPDDGIASYLWEQTAGPTVTLTPTTPPQAIFIAPNVGQAGASLTFRLTVTDNGGLKSTTTCVVNVTWINSPPQANAGPDRSVYGGDVVVLDGSASSDPDDGIKSCLWKQTSGSPVTLTNPTGAQASFTAPQVDATGATLTFLLTVTDNGGLQSTDTCNVYVKQKPGPDLTGSWASISYSSPALKGSFTVKNIGNHRTGSFVTKFYLSNDGATLGTLIAKSSSSYLNAAQSKTVSFKYSATGLPPKYIIAIVDADNSVAETNEQNNRISAVIP